MHWFGINAIVIRMNLIVNRAIDKPHLFKLWCLGWLRVCYEMRDYSNIAQITKQQNINP